jgi:hypothetical protein
MNHLHPYPDLLAAYIAAHRLIMWLPWAAADPQSEEAEAIKALVQYSLFDHDDFGACTRALGFVAAECAALRSPRPAFFGRHWGESAPEVLADVSIDVSVLCAKCPGLYVLVAPFQVLLGPAPALTEPSFKPGEPLPRCRQWHTPESHDLWDSLGEKGRQLISAGDLPLDRLQNALAEVLRGDRFVLHREIEFELRAAARARDDASAATSPVYAVTASNNTPPPPKKQYLFVRRGNKYHLRFDGEDDTPRAYRGLEMAEFLLKQRGTWADLLDIDAALAVDRPLRTISEGEALASAEGDGEMRWNGFSGDKTADKAITAEQIKECEEAVQKLQAESNDAEMSGDIRRAKELDNKVQTYQRLIKEQKQRLCQEKRGFGINIRKETARCKWRNNLKDAIEHIKEKMPKLAAHLDEQIKPENYGYKYHRVEGIEWFFEEPPL